MNFPGTILVVDDEAHIRKFLEIILKQLGATSLLDANNGEEALAIYARERPALVLMDVNMPIMDGMQTLEKLRALDPDCAVIMLTSMANRSTVEAALEHGAINYIRKDTPKEAIIAALSETIATHFGPEKLT